MGGITKMKALKKGFTLIELIVVIAILAILALLIVPQVTGYVDQANKSVAIANADTCYTQWSADATSFASGISTSTPTPIPSSGCDYGALKGDPTASGTIIWSKTGKAGGYKGTVKVTNGSPEDVTASK